MDSQKIDDYHKARSYMLSLERKSAAERMAEYAETIDFPVIWDAGAPMSHLLTNGYQTLLMFYLQDDVPQGMGPERVALVEFHRCLSVKLGTPNEEVFRGHPLHGNGFEPYSAQLVRNSKWIKQLEAINKVHERYDPELWRSLYHYVFWFHDHTFECVAKSYEVDVFQKSMPEVFGEAAKRILAWSNRA